MEHREASGPDSAEDLAEDRWRAYYEKLLGRAPRPLFSRVRSIYRREGLVRDAVDLGCGDGTETLAMLDDGLSVTAIDGSTASMELLRQRAGSRPGLQLLQAQLEEVQLPATDLVYSDLTLPFCRPNHFWGLWERATAAVRPHGLIAVHLFGDRHEWVRDEMTFVTRGQVSELASRLTILDLREIDEPMPSAAGDMVRMHTFDLVARNGNAT